MDSTSFQRKKPQNSSKTFVYTVRDWKEYVGESFLIIFSVVLALVLTEYINSLHDKENTRNALKNLKTELLHNKVAIQEMKKYNLQVLNKINAALTDKDLQAELVSNDEFHLEKIAPQGILYRFLDNEAWTIAKVNNLMTRVDPETVALLYKVYEDQAHMMRVEDEVAKILFDRNSRDPRQLHLTLILIRDIYRGWAVDRADNLVNLVDAAVQKVEVF